MSLSKKYIELGNMFFKYRTYIPVFFIIPLLFFTLYKPELFFVLNTNWFILCFFISIIGQLIRAFTLGYTPIGTSGRNTQKQIANSLNTTGIYSIVRHPLYLGNYLIWIGIILFFYNLNLIILFSMFYYYYYQKIMYAEENFLIKKFKNQYIDWSNNVPTFIPKLRGYKKALLKFNLRKILVREYSNISGIFIGYILIYQFSIFIKDWDNYLNINVKLIFFIVLLFFFILRAIKKKYI